MSEINLFNRWKVKKNIFWLSVGGGAVLLTVAACIFTFLLMPFGAASQSYDLADAGGYYELEAPAADYGYDDSFAVVEEQAIAYAQAPLSPEEIRTEANSATVSIAGQPSSRLIIRNGSISIQVEDTRQTRDDIDGLVASLADLGAFTISSNEYGHEEERSPYISMVIRVPADQFDSVMDKLAGMAVRVNERIESADDVTEEFVDLQNRIEALEAGRDRLLEIMMNADTTEDLLYAEAQLTIREAELEALKGRLKYLSQSALLSRISIDIQPYILSQPIDSSWQPAVTFRRAVENLIDSIQDFADFMIVFTVAMLPWLLFFGLIIWGVIRFFKGRKAKKQAREADNS